jgi:hypothetical protein
VSRRKSAYGNADGPRPIWLFWTAVAVGLIIHGLKWPSLYSIVEIPAGALLLISMVGKMSAR